LFIRWYGMVWVGQRSARWYRQGVDAKKTQITQAAPAMEQDRRERWEGRGRGSGHGGAAAGQRPGKGGEAGGGVTASYSTTEDQRRRGEGERGGYPKATKGRRDAKGSRPGPQLPISPSVSVRGIRDDKGYCRTREVREAPGEEGGGRGRRGSARGRTQSMAALGGPGAFEGPKRTTARTLPKAIPSRGSMYGSRWTHPSIRRHGGEGGGDSKVSVRCLGHGS